MEQVTAPAVQTQSGSVNPLVISVTVEKFLDILIKTSHLSLAYHFVSELVKKSDGTLAICNVIEYIVTESWEFAKDRQKLLGLVDCVCKLVVDFEPESEELLALPAGYAEKFFAVLAEVGDYHSFKVLSEAFGKRTPTAQEIADLIGYHKNNRTLDTPIRERLMVLVGESSLSNNLKKVFSESLKESPTPRP